MTKASTPYFTVFVSDPIGTRIPVGAMVLHGHAIKYVPRKHVPMYLAPTVRAHIERVMERLGRNEHPWDIGPLVTVEGRIHFSFHDGDKADEWIAMVLDECSLARGSRKRKGPAR